MNQSDRKARKPLPCNFKPGPFDVICARGKIALEHPGNQRLRALVKQNLPVYSSSKCKFQKSRVVSNIVSSIQSASPEGGFVKCENDVWCRVSQRHAREKVGQAFRDTLHTKYSSSAKAKAKSRKEKTSENAGDNLQTAEEPTSDLPRSSSSVVSWTSSDGNDKCIKNETFPTNKPPSIISYEQFAVPLGTVHNPVDNNLFLQYQQLLQAANNNQVGIGIMSNNNQIGFGINNNNQINGKLTPTRRFCRESPDLGVSVEKLGVSLFKEEPQNNNNCIDDFDFEPLPIEEAGTMEPLPIEESTLDKYFDLSAISNGSSSALKGPVMDNIDEVCHRIFEEYL